MQGTGAILRGISQGWGTVEQSSIGKNPNGGLWENNEGGHLAREISEGFLEEVLSGSPGQGWRELSENPGERDLAFPGPEWWSASSSLLSTVPVGGGKEVPKPRHPLPRLLHLHEFKEGHVAELSASSSSCQVG